MRATLLRLMLPFLLLSQVVVGMSPGHAICIALDACCGLHVHAEAPEGGGFHDHDHGHGHGHGHGHHEHGDRGAFCADGCANSCCPQEEACDGDCSEGSGHFHVALPDDGGCTRDRSNDHFCDLRLLAPALALFAIQPVVDLHAQSRPPVPWVWPDCDRACALETDRLLI